MTSELAVVTMDRDEFEAAESVIEHGLQTFVEVGQALMAIREGRGYQHAGYPNFESYCQDRWHMRHQNADRLIRSAEVAGLLNPMGFNPRERQARELTPLLQTTPESISEVWREAVETAPNHQVTAAHIAQVVERHARPVPEPESRPMREAPLLRFSQDLPTATIVSLILKVFFPDAETALDMTYGSGAFWDGSTSVRVTATDADPTRAVDGTTDFRNLSYPNATFDVTLFDPPHIADAGAESIMGQRFGTYPDADLQDAIRAGAAEAMRVARLGAIIKVTDHIHGQRFVRESGWVILELGEPYDVVHQVRSGAMIDPKWEEQRSAYNNGSTYLIFRKDGVVHARRRSA